MSKNVNLLHAKYCMGVQVSVAVEALQEFDILVNSQFSKLKVALATVEA